MSNPLDSNPTDQPTTRHVRVKICGVTTLTDALAAASARADWIGLNFHPPSPRYVEPDVAAAIVAGLPPSVEPVGVFVNRPSAEVRAIAEAVGLRAVQLHGDEPPEDLRELSALQLVRAFRLGDEASIGRMVAYVARALDLGRTPDFLLIDADVAGLAGGTGQMIPTDLLERLPSLPRLILAGGLTPENVAERVARVRPWMVDVASGVESSPGRKDPARIAAFIRAARSAAQRVD